MRTDETSTESSLPPLEGAQAFVLECIRGCVRRGELTALRILARDEWPAILTYGAAQGVLPIVYAQVQRRLQSGDRQTIPDSLRTRYIGNATRNLMLAGEIQDLSHDLAAAGVRSLALKGPALSWLAYGSVAYREFSDLDLLVSKVDLERASCVLRERGYAYWNKLGMPQHVERRLSNDHSFVRGDVHLELHWQLTPHRIGFAPDFEELWRRRTFARLAESEPVPTLSFEDHLLLLCVHGAKHGWPRLGWVADVAGLIVQAPALDARAVIRRARRYHVLRMLRVGLLLASRLCQIRLSPAFRDLLPGDATAAELATHVESHLLSPCSAEPDWRQSLGFQWVSRERWRDRVRLFARTGTSPEFPLAIRVPGWVRFWEHAAHAWTPNYCDFKRVPMPGWLWGLYFLIRPLRFARAMVRRSFTSSIALLLRRRSLLP